MGHPSDDHRRTRGVDGRVEGFCPGRRMSTNAKASVATSSCFPTYEFKADFLKDGSATLKVHNKTPTLDKVRTLIIPSSPPPPEPWIIELPEEGTPITPCSKTTPSTLAAEKQVNEQREEPRDNDIRSPSLREHSQQEQQTVKSQEVAEVPSLSLREVVMKSRDRHVTTKSDLPNYATRTKVSRIGSMFNQVKVPEQKPQTGLPVIEEMQSGETEDKTLTEDPLSPNGQLYDKYFEPEKHEPCARSLRRKEKEIKHAQEDKDFEKKWNETPSSPPSKEIKDTAQPGKEIPSDPVVPTPSVPANRKWLYDLLHRKNPPTIMPKKQSFKDELRDYFKFPPQKSKQCEKSDKKDAPRTYCGTEYDFMEEFRRSDTFTGLDLLLDWCDDKFTEKITPSLVQRFRSLDDHWLLSEIRGLRSQIADVMIEARKSDRKDLIMKVLIASEQHRIQHETRALIDSGCTVSCINEETVRKLNLEKKPLEHAVPVRNADGTLNAAGSITHVVTARLEFDLNGETHAETIQLAVTKLGREDIFLGYDWLKKHNPAIDWVKGDLTFPHCTTECCGSIYNELEQDIREQDIRAYSNISTDIAIKQEEAKEKKTSEQIVPESLHEF